MRAVRIVPWVRRLRPSGRAADPIAVGPPVGPVAGEGVDGVAEAGFGFGEEVAVDRHPQARVDPGGVPIADDLGDGQTRWGVVGETVLDAEVEDVVGVGLLGDVEFRRQTVPTEDALIVGVGPGGERLQVVGEETAGGRFALAETGVDTVHVGETVGRVGMPDEEAFAVGPLPPEGARQFLTTVGEGEGAAGVVVGDVEIADTGGGQQVEETDSVAGDVGLDGGDDVETVLFAELVGERQTPGEFVDRVDLGVHAEGERVDLDPALLDPAHELVAHGLRSGREPMLERVGDLDVPAELRVFRPVVGRRDEVEDGVEVAELVLHHDRLGIGVAIVEVGVVDEVDRPLALRHDLDVAAGAGCSGQIECDGEGGRRGDLGNEEMERCAAGFDRDGGAVEDALAASCGKGDAFLRGRGFDPKADRLLETAVLSLAKEWNVGGVSGERASGQAGAWSGGDEFAAGVVRAVADDR